MLLGLFAACVSLWRWIIHSLSLLRHTFLQGGLTLLLSVSLSSLLSSDFTFLRHFCAATTTYSPHWGAPPLNTLAGGCMAPLLGVWALPVEPGIFAACHSGHSLDEVILDSLSRLDFRFCGMPWADRLGRHGVGDTAG